MEDVRARTPLGGGAMAAAPPPPAASDGVAGAAEAAPPWGWEAWYTSAAIAAAFALMLLDLAKPDLALLGALALILATTDIVTVKEGLEGFSNQVRSCGRASRERRVSTCMRVRARACTRMRVRAYVRARLRACGCTCALTFNARAWSSHWRPRSPRTRPASCLPPSGTTPRAC